MITLLLEHSIPATILLNGKIAPYRIEVSSDQTLIFTIIPHYYNQAYLPISSVVSIQNNCVNCSGGFTIVDWGQGYYSVCPCPPLLQVTHSPITITQQCVGGSIYTLYDDGSMHLMCEGDKFFAKDIPYITNAILNVNHSTPATLVLSGKTGEKMYYLVLHNEGDWKVVYDFCCESIEVLPDHILVTRALHDMQGRICTASYNTQGIISQSFTYSKSITRKELIPYAFLEGILCGDRNCMSYFSPDLPDYDTACEYIGEFDTISPLPYNNEDFLRVGVYKKSPFVKPTILHFEIQNNIIVNFTKGD